MTGRQNWNSPFLVARHKFFIIDAVDVVSGTASRRYRFGILSLQVLPLGFTAAVVWLAVELGLDLIVHSVFDCELLSSFLHLPLSSLVVQERLANFLPVAGKHCAKEQIHQVWYSAACYVHDTADVIWLLMVRVVQLKVDRNSAVTNCMSFCPVGRDVPGEVQRELLPIAFADKLLLHDPRWKFFAL
jgi:hypothetical protein